MLRKMLLVLFLIITLFSFSFVSAVEVIEKDIGDYSFYRSYNHTPALFIPIQYLTYIDNSTDLRYKVQVIEFNKEADGITFNSEYLDTWITGKTEKNSGILTIGGNILFINEYSDIALWRSDNTYVQVRNLGGEEFPSEIIEAYLDIYPSDCNENGCISQEKSLTKQIRIDMGWFRNPPLDIKSTDYYSDRLMGCTGNYDKLKAEFDFSDGDIQKIEQHCQTNNNFRIEGAKIPLQIQECGLDLVDYLENKFSGDIDYDIILEECLLREKFKQNFPDKTDSYLLQLFDQRNREVLKEINFSGTAGTKGKIRMNISDGTIKKADERKINSEYLRNESKDLENFRSKLDLKNPSTIDRIESNTRQDKPMLDIADENESNFQGLFRKLFGWLPWFKK